MSHITTVKDYRFPRPDGLPHPVVAELLFDGTSTGCSTLAVRGNSLKDTQQRAEVQQAQPQPTPAK